MSQHFSIMETNPNVGHGCLCSEEGTVDSNGPFVVFNATEMDTVPSPFPVLCAGCACKAADLVRVAEAPITAADIEVIDTEIAARSKRRKPADDIPEV